MLRLLDFFPNKRASVWPDYIHDQTPPLARSESLQLWNDLIFNTSTPSVDSRFLVAEWTSHPYHFVFPTARIPAGKHMRGGWLL